MVIKRACISIVFLLIIALLIIPSTSAQYPRKVLDAKESTVYIFAWIEGTIDIYFNDTGWVTKNIMFPFKPASGFFINDNGYVMTTAHTIEHNEVDLQLSAVRAYVLSQWWDWGYKNYKLDEFSKEYYFLILEKMKKGEFNASANKVDYYVYWYKEDEPHKARIIPIGGAEKYEAAILKIEVSDTPFITLNDIEAKEETRIYTIGYAAEDVDRELSNAVEKLMDPLLRPSTFQEFIKIANKEMLKSFENKGPSVQGGELSTITTIGTMDVYRYNGYAGDEFSGAPIISKDGDFIGMMWLRSTDNRGYIIPYKFLKLAADEGGVVFPLPEESPPKWIREILYAIIAAIIIAYIERKTHYIKVLINKIKDVLLRMWVGK